MQKKGLLTLALAVGLSGAANASIQLPFSSGKPWYVCNGYNAFGKHANAPVLDLSVDSNSPVSGGCDTNNGNALSAGELVVSPVAGDLVWFSSLNNGDADMACITIKNGKSVGMGHFDATKDHAQTGPIGAGQRIGMLAVPNVSNNRISHIHIQAHSVPGCHGNLIPFDDAHGMRFEGAPDLPYDGSPNQWSGQKLPALFLPGTLVRVENQLNVYLVSMDDPLVLFYKDQIIIASPSGTGFFDKKTKTFLGQNTDARGNMEMSDLKN